MFDKAYSQGRIVISLPLKIKFLYIKNNDINIELNT